ncbi:MAG: NAD(P)H-dependent oxidoreductase [Glaciihabitans sp.]|jgi:NAD(P)H-dependent FMN reductase|nr:NAD(P)H-dependent oxidoreductase [Glaciihabitans sp.]
MLLYGIVTKLMIVVGSVRPGRVGLPIAEWVRGEAEKTGKFEIDFVDLAELALPFMDEPTLPRFQQYTLDHTKAWSERVAAAEAFVFVTPEYNYSYSPALKNAIDFLNVEWWRKPLGFVSYGGVSSGTRGVAALMPVTGALGLVRVGANVELTFGGLQVVDGVFEPKERESSILVRELDEIDTLAQVLTPLRANTNQG